MNWNVIPKNKLIVGQYYRGGCRNAEVARWNGKYFLYWRYKFGDCFLEEICHPEDDKHYDVFYAQAIENNPQKEIPI
jgi:hypothetical protein